MLKRERDIYKEPVPRTIAGNIGIRQLLLINRFFDMGYIVATSDSSIVLHSPIMHIDLSKTAEQREEEYSRDRKTFEENFARNIKLSKKLDKRFENLDEMFSRIREVYPDFCKDMQSKIPSEDYELYLKQQKRLKKALDRTNTTSYEKVGETLIEQKDRISEVVDSEECTRACRIESAFLIEELQRYFEILRGLPAEEQKSQNKHTIPYENSKISVAQMATHVMTERKQRVKSYDEILKLFDKLKGKKFVRLVSPNKEDDDGR